MGTPPESLPVGQLRTLLSIVQELEIDAARRNERRRSGLPWGPVTGFPTLDRELGGALEPGLHVFHAGPGTGKSALALQIAGQCGCPALVVSAEMLPVELLRRLAARHSGTPLGIFKSGKMPKEEARSKALRAVEGYPLLSIADGTRQGITLAELERFSTLRRGDATSFLLVVDSLHSWAEGAYRAARSMVQGPNLDEGWRNEKDPSEYELINWAISGLQRLSAQLQSPVIVVAERNRASADDDGMGSAAGSRKFEYSAETVVGLSAPKERTAVKTVLLKLAKNRHGEGYAEVLTRFNGALQRFTELDQDEAEAHRAALERVVKPRTGRRGPSPND